MCRSCSIEMTKLRRRLTKSEWVWRHPDWGKDILNPPEPDEQDTMRRLVDVMESLLEVLDRPNRPVYRPAPQRVLPVPQQKPKADEGFFSGPKDS